jgi:prevent-host-death family protein
MMNSLLDTRQIHPLTDFLRNHKKYVARIEKTAAPLILTVNGKASVVVQDAENYQKLVELAHRAQVIQAIRVGQASAERGDGKQAEQLFDELMESIVSSEE